MMRYSISNVSSKTWPWPHGQRTVALALITKSLALIILIFCLGLEQNKVLCNHHCSKPGEVGQRLDGFGDEGEIAWDFLLRHQLTQAKQTRRQDRRTQQPQEHTRTHQLTSDVTADVTVLRDVAVTLLATLSQRHEHTTKLSAGTSYKHTTSPISHTRPSSLSLYSMKPNNEYSFPILLRLGGWVDPSMQ